MLSINQPSPYKNQITFTSNDNGLFVEITTERTYIRSVLEEDQKSLIALFGDKEVMKKYAEGVVRSKESTEERIKDVWRKRWKEHDPFSAFAVFERETKEFMGWINLGHGEKEGQAEIAYLFREIYWNKRYGSECVKAIVEDYAQAIINKKYLLEEAPLRQIVATARVDNLYSCRILEKIGMKKSHTSEKYGAKRNHYSLLLNESQKKSSEKVDLAFSSLL